MERPRTVGSIFPSSRSLAEMMLAQINPQKTSRVAEIGPGTGSITRVLIEKLASPSQYFGLDVNEEFIGQLKQEFPLAKFEVGSAERLDEHLIKNGIENVDDILSGLPWTIFSKELRGTILASIGRALTADGTFTTFTYVSALMLPNGREFMGELIEHFDEIHQSPIVWGNLPPAVVLHGRRSKSRRETPSAVSAASSPKK